MEPKQPAHKDRVLNVAGIVRAINGQGIATQNYQDIGRYTVFNENHWRRMFPRKAFGRLEEEEYTRNETYGIMTREEGLRFTNDFNRITTPGERNIDYSEIV